MKFTTTSQALAEAVDRVAKFVPGRPDPTILGGIKIEVSGTSMTLSAYDFEIGAKATIAVETGEDGQALVSGRALAAVARVLPKTKKPVMTTVAIDGNDLTINAGRASVTLPLMMVADYPALPATGTDFVIEFDAQEFRSAVAAVSWAVAKGDEVKRPLMQCVLLRRDSVDDDVTVAIVEGVSSNRMSRISAPLIKGEMGDPIMISLDSLTKALASVDGDTIVISVTGGLLTIEGRASISNSEKEFAGGGWVVMRTIDDTLLEDIVSGRPYTANENDSAVLDRDELLELVTRGAALGEGDVPLIDVTIDDNEVQVRTHAGNDRGQMVDSADVGEHEGEPLQWVINADYLKGAIASFPAGDITVRRSPGLGLKFVLSDDESDHVAVVMGIKQ